MMVHKIPFAAVTGLPAGRFAAVTGRPAVIRAKPAEFIHLFFASGSDSKLCRSIMPSMASTYRIIVAGGGAAGFFAAIAAAETYPGSPVTLLERSAQVLSKVRMSGGGRCNVTHASFDPAELV